MIEKAKIGNRTQGQQRLRPERTFVDVEISVSAATDQKEEKAMTSYISYVRVSTQRQGDSGLGLEAQQAAIRQYVGENGKIIANYQDIESGRRDNRPELARALDHARRSGATLIIAKLDRLSRNAAFLLNILDSAVDVVFCDMPQVSGPTGRFLLTSMAAVAQLESEMCSQRTREALQAAKRRGVVLGARKGKSPLSGYLQAHGNGAGVAGNVKSADARAENWRETLESMIAKGLTAYGIAAALRAKGEKTARGATWTTCAVARLVRRLEIEIPA